MTPIPRLRVLIVILASSGLLLGAGGAPAAAATIPPPTFGQPTISGIQGVGFEQDLRLDPTNPNRVYTSVPGSLSSDTSWIWHSEDGGKTFKWVTAGTAKVGKPTPCAGGGDTELGVDTGGNLYFNDLTLANFSTARSEDGGKTFICSNTGVPDTAVDRQWYAIDGNPRTGTGLGTGAGHNIYLANDEIGPGAVTCPNSGLVNNVLAMYRSPTPVGGGATAGVQFGPGNKVTRTLSCDEGIMGNDEVSPVASTLGQPMTPSGFAPLATAVKHVYVIHDDATFTKIAIGRCFPVAFGAPVTNVSDPSGLNCVDLPVADLGAPGTVRTGGNFPTLAIDAAGNLYALWEQAPEIAGKVGNTSIRYAFSSDQGNHWSTPITIPTPSLLNDVFAWPAAGDRGRVDVAFYGTSAPVDATTGGPSGCTSGGPDSVDGTWSLYMVQTLNAASASPSFTAPILASEHHVHKGGIQTVLGHQCGDRTLGDFLQLRVGSRGEAQIAYADSNNADEPFAPHGMYVKQNGGSGLRASTSPVTGDPILLNAANDPSGDAKRETNGVTGPNMPNLDILRSSMFQPDPAGCHPSGTPCYRVNMTVNNLSLVAPGAPDPVAVWSTQWLLPADPACTSTAASCKHGGKNPFVYFESNGTCWSGENAATLVGGGAMLTYPGTKAITSPGACSFRLGPFGTITIDVPIADVSLDAGVAPLSNRLFSVTASTMTLSAPPEMVAPVANIGGVLFDLIDVVRAYDFVPGGAGGGGCHEADGDGAFQGEQSGNFQSDEDACEDGDQNGERMSDPGHGEEFHSTQVNSVSFDDAAGTMTVEGLGVNQAGTIVSFLIVETAATATSPASYIIALTDGYIGGGALVSGTITLT